jgi:hypothetical protein
VVVGDPGGTASGEAVVYICDGIASPINAFTLWKPDAVRVSYVDLLLPNELAPRRASRQPYRRTTVGGEGDATVTTRAGWA